MPRLRVGYVIGSLDVGGSERQLWELATRLDRARFESSICCLAREGPQAAAARELGIPVRTLGAGRLRYAKWFSWARRLRRWFRDEQLDVAHAFLFPSYALAAFAASGLQTRVVAGIRSAGAGPEGHWPFSRFEEAGLRRAVRIVVNADAVGAEVSRRHAGVAAKLMTIPNGIDPAIFVGHDRDAVRSELSLPRDAVVVLMVANLIAYKGHEDALRAFARLRTRVPAAKLALAGTGPEERRIRASVSELGLGSSVLLLGSRPDIPRLLAASDIALLASHVEGLPNAILEASAAAKPVVATRVGGIPEIVLDGVTGLLTEPGDVDGIAAALYRLTTVDYAARLGLAGRALVLEKFSWERVIAAHEALYVDLCDRAPVKSRALRL